MKLILKGIAIIVVALPLVVLAFALNSLVHVSHSPARSEDSKADEAVARWENLVRWGMTNAEIQAVYPNTEMVKDDLWDSDGRKYRKYSGYARLAESIRVVEYDFDVTFRVDDSERLAAVQLYKDFREREFVNGASAFDTVNRLLVQKYGKPNVESDKEEKTQFIVTRESVWQSAKAQIRLDYLSTERSRESYVILTYEMP